MNSGGANKIVFFLKDHLNRIGGMETHAINFIKYFKEKNLLKAIVYDGYIEAFGVNGATSNINYNNFNKLIEYLHEENFNVFFFNDGQWIESIAELRKQFPHVCMIMRSGGNEIMKAPLSNDTSPIKNRRKIWAQTINKLDFIIANSAYSINRMLSMGISRDKIILVRGGVDLDFCRFLKSKRQILQNKIRQKCHIPNNTIILGIIARLEPFKGIIETLEVLKDKQELNWYLVLVGSGSQENYIKSYLYENFSKEKYTFLGKLDNQKAIEIIASLDFLLNMSLAFNRESGRDYYIHTETMGRSMLEAISCGVPIIATNVGGIPEIFFENEDIGYLLEDVKQLSQCLDNIFFRPTSYHILEQEKYSWDHIFGKLYNPLMNIKKNKSFKVTLVFDIDETITHKFLSDEENTKLLSIFLSLYECCNIIVNTACDISKVFDYYPILKNYIEKIILIANGGSNFLIYGKELDFWKNYEVSDTGLGKFHEELLYKVTLSNNARITKQSKLHKHYYNYKVDGITENLIIELTEQLRNTHYQVLYNDNNLKLVTKVFNKATSLNFILRHLLEESYVISLGNGVLDEGFLENANKGFLINNSKKLLNVENINITSLEDMHNLYERIVNCIKNEKDFNCYS